MNQQGDQAMEEMEIKESLSKIKHRVLVLSGKGGVGKSTVAANIAMSLALNGKKVGLMDIDIHGPSIPKMLGLEGKRLTTEDNKIIPLEVGNLKVISIGFMLEKNDDAVIWRGPMKYTIIRQFIKDVKWGQLDYLIVDSPPGTGDEPLSIVQVLGKSDGAVIVTTPQDVSIADVRKSVNFCHKLDLPVIGVVENMSGFICPHCEKEVKIFKKGGGKKMAEEMNVPFLGEIPLDPQVVEASDDGKSFVYFYSKTKTAENFNKLIKPLMELKDTGPVEDITPGVLKIAIPTVNNKLNAHFGHAEMFTFCSVDLRQKKLIEKTEEKAPPHEPGKLPKWVREKGARLVIAGGMGDSAMNLFKQNDVDVICGAPAELTPEEIISKYLNGTLRSGLGDNCCGCSGGNECGH